MNFLKPFTLNTLNEFMKLEKNRMLFVNFVKNRS